MTPSIILWLPGLAVHNLKQRRLWVRSGAVVVNSPAVVCNGLQGNRQWFPVGLFCPDSRGKAGLPHGFPALFVCSSDSALLLVNNRVGVHLVWRITRWSPLSSLQMTGEVLLQGMTMRWRFRELNEGGAPGNGHYPILSSLRMTVRWYFRDWYFFIINSRHRR